MLDQADECGGMNYLIDHAGFKCIQRKASPYRKIEIRTVSRTKERRRLEASACCQKISIRSKRLRWHLTLR